MAFFSCIRKEWSGGDVRGEWGGLDGKGHGMAWRVFESEDSDGACVLRNPKFFSAPNDACTAARSNDSSDEISVAAYFHPQTF